MDRHGPRMESSFPKLNHASKEIRLLHVASAAQPSDLIQCRFSITSLSSEAEYASKAGRDSYEALSYVWGLEKHERCIQLNNNLVEVTTNLYQALQHLRLPDRERVIWIDALCINQSDLTERKHQVSLMRDVYEKATSVIIWLGPSWDHCPLAMECLERMGQDKSLHIHPEMAPSLSVKEKNLTSVEVQDSLKKLFGTPWWSRVWTVQEWILANRSVFQCGQFLLDGQLLRQGVRSYFDHLDKCCWDFRAYCPSNNQVFQALIAMETVEYIRLLIDEVSLPYIFSQFRSSREATNMCDKVYGMLGLARGKYRDIIEPNYEIPVERVFELTVLKMIEHTGSLEVLSHIPKAGEHNLHLPSFVPDWTVLAKTDYYYTDWLNWVAHLHLWRASGASTAELKVIQDGSIALRGTIIDTVEQMSSVPGTLTPASFLAELKRLASPVITSDPSLFWSAICGTLENYLDPRRDNRPFYRRRPRSPHLTDLTTFEAWEAWYPSFSAHGLTPDVLAVHRPFKVMVAGRRFAVTRQGRLAWCPMKSLPGDSIAILNGATVPFVLRRDGEGGRYSVVGDAFVQGVMDGEAFDGECASPGTSDEFIELA